MVEGLPDLGIVSRIGAGFDTVDTDACARHGVWVANSPDYGVGEVATHALALALASLRNIAAYDRDVRAGRWHYLSSGVLRRAAELTLGIVGLGRIGKRMAHISRNVFKRVVAYDPHLIDGDFPAYVERVRSLTELALARRRRLASTRRSTTRRAGSSTPASSRRPRPGMTLVNTARGAVVALPDLLKALDAGILRGVALDVLPVEPVPADSAAARAIPASSSRRMRPSSPWRRSRSCGARRRRTSSRGRGRAGRTILSCGVRVCRSCSARRAARSGFCVQAPARGSPPCAA